MPLVALAILVCTALSGLVILGAWLTRSEVRRARGRRGRHRRLPPTLVFSHVGFALAGAATWVAFTILGRDQVGWASLGLLVVTAMLGATMFIRWIPSYRRPIHLGVGPGSAHRAPDHSNLPIAVVVTHGIFAVTTAALVIWTVFVAI
ncbi:hypothetical protein [Skermania sp. ID1734]|uniref:hypothetical protein n=1 Tax=Skermania sp. ID1734 TaxID=2597516 RepID=UPI00163DD547|nr:hypothetical protein [Skermania sp. ID1734]